MTTEKSIGVDPQSLELAKHFLSDMGGENTILADLLAERIQSAVEDWFDELFVGIPNPMRQVTTPISSHPSLGRASAEAGGLPLVRAITTQGEKK